MIMSQSTNRRIVMVAHPEGAPTDDDFRLEESPLPEPGAGQMLCRTIYLSLDPYMRGRMNPAKSYTPGVEAGQVMVGGTVSQVSVSNLDGFAPGDVVVGQGGWQEYAVSDGTGVRKLDAAVAPLSTALGVLGMPGMTAYVGLRNIGQPKEGETVVVAAASGPVGATVGQIARIKGARAVGIAGSAEKCDYVTGELGFDACVNHRQDGFAEALAAACPEGIDVYWENVGGPVFQAVVPLLNPFSRVPVCGMIAHYNATRLPDGPDRVPVLMRQVLSNRVLLRGFIVWDFAEQEQDFLDEMGAWIRERRVKYREDVVDGLENAPAAFQGLLRGANFGKLIVRVGAEP
jgi:NADPH-dependent curcumin reductase CurA